MRQAPSIDAYGGGGFRVSGVWREGSLLILDDEPRRWPVTRMDELTPQAFDEVIAAGPSVVEFVLPPSSTSPLSLRRESASSATKRRHSSLRPLSLQLACR